APPPPPAVAPPPAPAAALPAPRPVPPGARLVMTALEDDDAGPWDKAVADAFPGPDWHMLPASADPAQIAADVAFLRPAVIVAGTGARAGALLSAVAALTGRAREGMAVLAVGDFPGHDPLAAFALGADAVLAADPADAAARLADACARRRALPSLFRPEAG
ncbi:hypothetical protein, partial [Solidesulfovibrio sp.]|uniref:hypothetical protein n=1 Tax=Solidesulfovibrio sp. TaxID=2910990 RepID=UPI00260D55A7